MHLLPKRICISSLLVWHQTPDVGCCAQRFFRYYCPENQQTVSWITANEIVVHALWPDSNPLISRWHRGTSMNFMLMRSCAARSIGCMPFCSFPVCSKARPRWRLSWYLAHWGIRTVSGQMLRAVAVLFPKSRDSPDNCLPFPLCLRIRLLKLFVSLTTFLPAWNNGM